MTLDLHGVKHEQVSGLVDVFIWLHMQKKTSQVAIITGNSDTMKKLVHECISGYGYDAHEDISNSATLIIDMI